MTVDTSTAGTRAPLADDDDPFSDPATGSSMDAFKDLVVIIKPLSTQKKPSKKGNGLVDTVSCEIIAVDGPEPGFTSSTVSYSNSLNPQIISKIGQMVIGKLTKKDFGRGEGWDLEAATKEQRQAGVKVLNEIKAKLAAKANNDDPFAG